MAEYKSKWVGLDCGPLPHESTPSLIGRFSSLNGIDRRALREQLGFWMNASTDTFARGFGFREDLITHETGWQLPGDEKTVLTSRPVLVPWLFASRVRFCPTCLESGFHSFWFQLESVQTCPLHTTPIADKCQCCGQLAGGYSDLPGKASAFYACEACGRPLGGRAFSWSAHDILRSRAKQIDEAFGSLRAWWCDSNSGLDIVEQLVVQNTLVTWYVWCDARDFLRRATTELAPMPQQFADAHAQGQITLLQWNIRLTSSRWRDTDSSRGRLPYSSVGQALYASMLSRLCAWAFPDGAGARCAGDMLALREKGFIDGTNREANQLALAWFRLLFEDASSTPFEWINTRRATWSGRLRARHIGAHVQRLPARAILLGVFAVMLEITKRQQASGEAFHLDGLRPTIPSLVPLVYQPGYPSPAGDERSQGLVMFPSIHNLNLDTVWPSMRHLK
ncbi:TniQ family protein [Paraburkholderia sp. RL17-337-BIB-A]|uniref:TniQ family protein n=1 Tax=Paraburkholderia sp. RL17-337-BIB-A TaxID=3031636 RepID=UPI0038B6EC23